MKNILLITTIVTLLFTSSVFAQKQITPVQKPKAPAQAQIQKAPAAQPVIVIPAQPVVIVPMQPTYVMRPPVPPKPNFKTPLRDTLWKSKVYAKQMLWTSRVSRYNRLGTLLGPQVIVQPQYPYTPQPQ